MEQRPTIHSRKYHNNEKKTWIISLLLTTPVNLCAYWNTVVSKSQCFHGINDCQNDCHEARFLKELKICRFCIAGLFLMMFYWGVGTGDDHFLYSFLRGSFLWCHFAFTQKLQNMKRNSHISFIQISNYLPFCLICFILLCICVSFFLELFEEKLEILWPLFWNISVYSLRTRTFSYATTVQR